VDKNYWQLSWVRRMLNQEDQARSEVKAVREQRHLFSKNSVFKSNFISNLFLKELVVVSAVCTTMAGIYSLRPPIPTPNMVLINPMVQDVVSD